MFEARVTNALNPCMVQKVTKKFTQGFDRRLAREQAGDS